MHFETIHLTFYISFCIWRVAKTLDYSRQASSKELRTRRRDSRRLYIKQ